MSTFELTKDEGTLILKSLAMLIARVNDADVQYDAYLLRAKIYDSVMENKENEVQHAA